MGRKGDGNIQGGEVEFYKLMKVVTTQDYSGSPKKKYQRKRKDLKSNQSEKKDSCK